MKTRLLALLDKEWTDALKNRYILYLTLLLPALFVILPSVMLYITTQLPAAELTREMGDMPAGWKALGWEGITPAELLQVATAGQFTLFFLIVPLAIPMTIATYSVTGEKRDRSLEPLLATPITTFELLLGKSLAAAAPGVAITWICALLFTVVSRFLAVSDRAWHAIVSTTWLLNILLLAPLLTVLATTVGLMVSSRVNDPRAAEQLGMVVIIPVLAIFFGQMAGVISLSPLIVVLVSFALLVVDVALIAVGVGLFQRETILTRWK